MQISEQDKILLNLTPVVSKTFWCSGCGVARPMAEKMVRIVSKAGRVTHRHLCKLCNSKKKSNK